MPASASGIGAGVVCTFTNAAIPPPGDSGDAPNTYGTLNASTGARHEVPNYNGGNNTAPLMLGAKIDVEADGAAGVNATGDDAAGVDDEDGVVFNTDVSVPGRLETVFVTASAAGVLNGWIDFDRDGTFGAAEQIFDDRAVVLGDNRLTYTVPTGSDFEPGDTFARFRLTSATGQADTPTGVAPNGEVEDYRRVLFDAEQEALEQCPRGSIPVPVGIIQNASLEDWEQTFNNNTSANTINHAEHWFDSHATGGQYYVFSPTFDSGPAASVMPFRAGADGYGFLGGHTSTPETPARGPPTRWPRPWCPERRTSASSPSVPAGTAATAAATCGCSGPATSTPARSNATSLTAANSEAMFDTPVVCSGARPAPGRSGSSRRSSCARPRPGTTCGSRPATPPRPTTAPRPARPG